MSPLSRSLGGVTLPISDEIGNALFNNPAALARNTKFKSEFLNLGLDANSGILGDIGLSTTKMTGLGGMSETLNANPNKLYSEGISNLTAVAWGGLGVGLLFQERVRAYSDGTTANYETLSQVIPAVGYGLSLARGVIRVGYSLQWVNQTAGTASAPSNSQASFLSGINQGRGFSHTGSVNFVFPFTYVPTLSLVARNIGGVHYSSGSLLSRAQNITGIPGDERMSVDASLNFMVRISGTAKTYWYVQYRDATGAYPSPLLEKLNVGLDLGLSDHFGIRVGMTGTHYSFGVGYKSDSSEINLARYDEQTPFSDFAWDTRYALQYKIYFQDKNTRDRESELKGR